MEKKSFLAKIIAGLKGEFSRRQRVISFLISMAFSLVVVAGITYNLFAVDDSFEYNPLAPIDTQIIDGFFISRYKSSDSAEVLSRDKAMQLAMIKIDDDSLRELEMTWPIRRSIYAEILQKLRAAGAKTIGFDIILQDPSPFPDADKELAKTLATMDNVFLVENFYAASNKLDPEKMGSPDEDGEHNQIAMAEPYKPFFEAVKKNNTLGYVNVKDEKVIRRMQITRDYEGKPHYALPFAMAAHFLGVPQKDLVNHPSKNYFQFGSMQIPTMQNLIRINYFYPPDELSLKYNMRTSISEVINEVSLLDVLTTEDEEMLKKAFGGKIVLIGTTAEGAGDIKMTPFGHVPGVYCHANIILSILTGKYLKSTTPIFNIVLILIIGIVMGLLIPRLSPLAGFIFTVLFCTGYYQYSYYSFFREGTINYISAPIFCVFFGFLVINVYHHIADIKAKASISKMFKEFAPVPSNLIEKYIEKYGGSAATGGELAHMSILFSDIRGYTQMSENMTSQEVMQTLNEYHVEMGKIFAETGGVIFTYIGDAQLVVYGLEGPSKVNHAAAAIKAGLLMQEKMKELSSKLSSQGKQVFEVGVGICTGSLSIGVVGSQQLKQYTVIGDTVNVASRIQGMSRELNAPTLIHERTYLMARHCIEAERLRPVKLKGKKDLVNVYRAKKVCDIKQYPGDEIKDLDREVIELHTSLDEERQRRKEQAEADMAGAAHADSQAGTDEQAPAGVRKRIRYSKRTGTEEKPEDQQSDDLEPLEEGSKGSVPDQENN